MTDNRTIEVMGYFGKPKQITRLDYGQRWRDSAADLLHLGIDVREEARAKAEAQWDSLYEKLMKK